MLMDQLLHFVARCAVGLLQTLPILWVAHLGRCGGEAVFWLDRRHRRMALKNLTRCFSAEKSPAEIRAIAHENFRRIGENFCCAVKSAAMTEAEMREVLEVRGAEALRLRSDADKATSRVLASGHFGNFELLMRLSGHVPGLRCAATYRGIRQPAVDRLLYSLRTAGGGLFFERRSGAEDLKRAMNKGGLLLILVCDQSARDCGLELPFLGNNCYASRSPAILAARYGCELFVPICYRTSLGHWVIEVGEPIATRENGRRRSTDDITRDVNRAFEAGVRRDPANWFWVHNRWKQRTSSPTTETVSHQPVAA